MSPPTRKALFVLAYNRPGYTEAVFKSLCADPVLEEYDVWLFCDGPKEPNDTKAQQTIVKAFRENFPQGKHRVRERNYGVAHQNFLAFHTLFEKEGYTHVVWAPDDVVIAPYGLRALEALHTSCRFHQPGDNGRVCELYPFAPKISRAWKERRLDVVRKGRNFLFAMWDAKAWAAVRPYIQQYCEKFIAPCVARFNAPYAYRNSTAIRAWFADIQANGQSSATSAADGGDRAEMPTSVDHLLCIAMHQENVGHYRPAVNHCRYIGEWGEHGNPDVFLRLGAKDTELDLFAAEQVVQGLEYPHFDMDHRIPVRWDGGGWVVA
jgi:hypothetical protein